MAKYKVLRSTAHNYGHSFVSDVNMAPHDYVMCHLLRAAHRAGDSELTVDLLSGHAEPTALLPPPVADAVQAYVRGFGPHVQRSGAALDMVSAARLRVRLRWGHAHGRADDEPTLYAIAECEVEITDDRGRAHVGRAEAPWTCPAARTS